MLKKLIVYFTIGTVVAIALLVLWLSIEVKNENIEKKVKCETTKIYVDSIYNVAQTFLLSRQFDSSLYTLNSIDNNAYTCKIKPSVYDSVYLLKKLLIHFKTKLAEDFVKTILRDMTNDEYKQLCEKQLSYRYFAPAAINNYFIELLYDSRNNRNKYITEEKLRIVKIEKERAES